MNKNYLIVASLAVLTLSAPAFADSVLSTEVNGTNAVGTAVSVDQTVKVKEHKDGTTDTTVKTEESKDPKGLFNKSKVDTKETVTTDSAGKVLKAKKSVSGHVEEETTTK